MRNLKTIEKHYDKLTDHERFRLVIAAEVRDDYEEARRLNNTAPRADYRMLKTPYGDMREALIDCGMTAALGILEVGVFLAWGWGLYLGRRVKDWDPDEENATYEMIKEQSRQILAQWEALPLFAEDIGLDLEHVLYFVPSRSQIDLTVTMAQGVRDIEEKTMWAIIDRTTPEAEREALKAERAERMAKRRHEAARSYADQLLELFHKLTGDE